MIDAAAADAAVPGVDVSQPVSGVQAPVEKAPQGVNRSAFINISGRPSAHASS